jgi:hypothetical protein
MTDIRVIIGLSWLIFALAGKILVFKLGSGVKLRLWGQQMKG